MTKGLKVALVAALCAVNVSAAMAGEVRRMKSGNGLHVTYRPSSKSYCLRTTTDREAARLGLRLHVTQCGTADRWARQGLTVARRGDAARQMASVR